MDFEFIERVVRLVEEADIGELELEAPEGLKIVVKKSVPPTFSASPTMIPQIIPAGAAHPQPTTAESVPTPPAEDDSLEIIKAPMVGTFYRAPSPDSPSFVDVGGKVQNDTVVCILEAMKVMNEIKAGITGTIESILVENGQPVEYGQPLFKIRV